MLENLAAVDGIRTVVLSSAAMPPAAPASYTPSAVTTTPDGEGGDMRVLLADSTLTQVLGSVRARSTAPGASFAAQQRFLAETAMIAAQGGHLSRAIVVAPPRHWNPPAGLASALLQETTTAPWLSPVSAGRLAADKHAPGQVARRAPDDTGAQRFSRSMLRSIKAANRAVQQVQSIRVKPSAAALPGHRRGGVVGLAHLRAGPAAGPRADAPDHGLHQPAAGRGDAGRRQPGHARRAERDRSRLPSTTG